MVASWAQSGHRAPGLRGRVSGKSSLLTALLLAALTGPPLRMSKGGTCPKVLLQGSAVVTELRV